MKRTIPLRRTLAEPGSQTAITITVPDAPLASGADCQCAIQGLAWYAYASTPDEAQDNNTSGATDLDAPPDGFTATVAHITTTAAPERTAEFRFVARVLGDICPGATVAWTVTPVYADPDDAFAIGYFHTGPVFVAVNLQTHKASPQVVTIRATVTCPGDGPVTTNEITLIVGEGGYYYG
ncbi:MAG: hypothetical protein U1F68_15125 [Gammaproteobacteria bacterium]